MKGSVQWKNAALIVFMALLIAVPVGRISYSFGAASGGKSTSGVVAPTLDMLKAQQADQDKATQAWKEAKAQSDKMHSMQMTDTEKEMVTLGDKIIAAAAAGQKANQDLINYNKATFSAHR
jgi:hypothetical protein